MNSDVIKNAVINLARSQDRLEWFMGNAKAAGLKVERLDAIDAKDPDNQELISSYQSQGSKLNNAEIACILSHRKAWE